MRPVLTAAQVREADAYTIAHEPVRSIDLMERAGRAVYDWLFHNAPIRLFPKDSQEGDWRFTVLCGTGNNGGDGLVVARLLARNGYSVRVFLVRQGSGRGSPDFQENVERATKARIEIIDLKGAADIPALSSDEVVIDALFGTGLSKPIEGIHADVVKAINGSPARVVAIDLPSGLPADGCASAEAAIVRATHTLTFEVPKLSFFLRENAPFTGEWHVLPIGLDAGFIAGLPVVHHLLERSDVRAQLRPRPRFAHKGDFGHALLIAGSRGKMGAALLALKACLRSGVGLVTGHVPMEGEGIVHGALPEAMCTATGEEHLVAALPDLQGYSAIGIGPGIGRDERTARTLKLLVQEAPCPLVIDADGLNVLSENKTWLAFLPPGTILTPHPKEFDRLAGKSANGAERLERAREMATKLGAHIVLKGAYSAICDPSGTVLINPTGNPGMAKGGSGDVLTGLITGVLAQGHAPRQACLIGTYLHGLAGDLCAGQNGMDAMTAGDLVAFLPAAWRSLREEVK